MFIYTCKHTIITWKLIDFYFSFQRTLRGLLLALLATNTYATYGGGGKGGGEEVVVAMEEVAEEEEEGLAVEP